jgi:hypothetical protein
MPMQSAHREEEESGRSRVRYDGPRHLAAFFSPNTRGSVSVRDWLLPKLLAVRSNHVGAGFIVQSSFDQACLDNAAQPLRDLMSRAHRRLFNSARVFCAGPIGRFFFAQPDGEFRIGRIGIPHSGHFPLRLRGEIGINWRALGVSLFENSRKRLPESPRPLFFDDDRVFPLRMSLRRNCPRYAGSRA